MDGSDGPVAAASDAAELVEAALAHYCAALAATPAAIAWLLQHGIVNGDVIEPFGIGFADRSLGLSLSSGIEGRRVRLGLQAIGFLRVTGHEQFRGCVVVPIRDADGRVVQCYGRRVQHPKHSNGTAPEEALWLPTPGTGLWHPEALAAAEVIVADSVLDGLVWWSAGFRHVIAAGGPAGLPDRIAPLLADAGVRRVLLAHARTPDGERTAATLTDRLVSVGVECFRVVFASGTGASTLAVDRDDAATALGERLRAAVWLGQGPAPSQRSRSGCHRPARASIKPTQEVATSRPLPPATDSAPAGVDASPARDPGVPSPVPPPPVASGDVEVDGGELRATIGVLAWRVRGLDRVTGPGGMRVTASARHIDTGAFHLDVVDLFCARARHQFLTAAAGELGFRDVEQLRRQLGQLLLACEDRVLDLQHQAKPPAVPAPTMTVAEEEAALELLRDPRLLDRIGDDIAALGVVGERDNALLAYLAATSRLLETPLAVVVQADTGTGKSTVVDAVLSLMPAEARLCVSAITGQSLFYLDEAALAHKVLSVAEVQGATRAAYALKLLCGDGELSIASTGKDPTSGRLVTRTYRVPGPVALFLTTTAATLDNELTNRAVVLGVDDDQPQTRAILAAQRHQQTLAGLLAAHDRRTLRTLHANAQRLLEPVAVVNPLALQMTYADRRTRARRDQAKLLTLIRAVALLHQHQRPRRRVTRQGLEVMFIEATAADIAVAERLAARFTGRPELADLAPQTRRLLELLDTLVNTEARTHRCDHGDIRFTRRRAREHSGWSDYAMRLHLTRLVQLEFVVARRAGNTFLYELMWSEHDDRNVDSGDQSSIGGGYDPDLATRSRASREHLAAIARPAEDRF